MKTREEYASLIERELEALVPEITQLTMGEMPPLLTRSMRYSLLAGGKRLRPAMMLAATDMLDGKVDEALKDACAVEMIHTASLIHDDLPGMDNDTMRRGRPTCHIAFNEGQAIMAGDGLFLLAFETMLDNALRYPMRMTAHVRAIREIARGAGVTGMAAGQVLDLQCERERHTGAVEMDYIHKNKTACMFIYPLRAGALLAGAKPEAIEALTAYGEAFGRMFQAADDLLDVEGDTQALGKTVGKDAQEGKLTAINVYGLEGTRGLVDQLMRDGIRALSCFDERADFFRDLIRSMKGRTS